MITKTLALSFLVVGAVGLASADYNDAMSYFEQQEYHQALQEFREAAQRGDADAQYMLGRMHAAGNGTTQNFVQAHKWYNLAASRGHRHAAEARDALAERMTPAQIAEAQQAARGWQPGATSSSDTDTLSERERVAVVQRELNRLGYDAGPVDGVMGDRTRSAIYQYQADMGIAGDGRASADLVERLRQTDPEQVAAPSGSQSASSSRVVLRDDFSDGDYRRTPSWTVLSGDFDVNANGLRSVVTTQQAGNRTPSGLNSDRPEEVGLAVLGMILEQRRNGDNEAATRVEPAQIFVNAPVDNAFRVELELASSQTPGSLSLGVFQGNRPTNGTGYHLVYSAGSQPALTLVRQIAGNTETVARHDGRLELEDNRFHRLVWTRDENGHMEIRVDDRRLLRAQDNGLRDPFQGFVLANQGGDFTLGRIRIEE